MQSSTSGRQYHLPFLIIFRFPTRVVIDGLDTVAAKPEPQIEDDFFSSWDKPAITKPISPPITQAGAPVVGRPATPRTVTSSSIRSSNSSVGGGTTKLGASRPTLSTSVATSSTASSAPKKSKLGLGAKKAAVPIDFADAERKAVEEAERIKKLGYDRQREEEEERSKQETEKAEKAKIADTAAVARASTVPGKVDLQKGNSHDMERLGMGFRKLGFGAVPTPSPSIPSARATYVFLAQGCLPSLMDCLQSSHR